MKVALVYGVLPQDTEVISRLATTVELTLVASSWVFLPGGAYYTPTPPAGVRTVLLPPMVRSHRGHLWWWYRGLGRALREVQPDVTHVVTEPWGMLLTQTLRHAGAAAVVGHSCDMLWQHNAAVEDAVRVWRAKKNVRRLSGLASENRIAIDRAVQAGLPRGVPTAVIHTNPRSGETFPQATAQSRTEARRRWQLPLDRQVVGFVGRLVEQKGIDLLIEAHRMLHARGVEVTLAVCGDGSLRGLVEKYVTDGAAAVYVGALDYPHGVSEFLQSCDVVAVPSRSSASIAEQGPRVIIEALLSGCGVVASDSGAIPDMLSGLGDLHAEGDTESLADAISRVLAHIGDGRIDGQRRAAALARFGAEASCEMLLHLWSGAVRARSTSEIGG